MSSENGTQTAVFCSTLPRVPHLGIGPGAFWKPKRIAHEPVQGMMEGKVVLLWAALAIFPWSNQLVVSSVERIIASSTKLVHSCIWVNGRNYLISQNSVSDNSRKGKVSHTHCQQVRSVMLTLLT